MPTLRLKNVHPLGDVEVPALGRVGDEGAIKAGEEFDCPPDIAGDAPGVWRAPTDAEQADGLRGLVHREVGEGLEQRVEVLSPGSGLLGTRNFELVVRAKGPAKSTPNIPEA